MSALVTARWLALALAAGAAAPLRADEPAPAQAAPAAPPRTLVLTTGEVLRGTVLAETADTLTLSHPVLGTLTIPKSQLKQSVETPAAAPATLPDPAPPVVPAPPPPPPPETFWQGWKGQVEAGISGSSGNSENFNTRSGIKLTRNTPDTDTAIAGTHSFATDDGEKSKNRAEIEGRNDWKYGESPWGLFTQGRLEFDEFTNYKWRLTGSVGPSYTLFKPDPVLLRFRVGIGGSYEWAGPDPNETFVPEGLAGVDFTWKINDRQSLFANFEYLPSLRTPPDFRLDTKAGWQILVDPKTNLLLKVGFADRYNTNPGEQKRNDVDYFLTLALEF